MSCDLTSPLCGSCKAVTFTMLLDGFVHPKRFTDAVVSGRTCKLCRLMVCMYSKLQLQSPWSPYDVEKSYDTMSDSLRSLPAVGRVIVGREDLPSFETLKKTVDCLSWNRNEYANDLVSQPRPVLSHRNFGGGSTIQISVSKDSYYSSPVMVPIRDVTACEAPQNYTMLRKWLNNCIKSHKKCCPSGQYSDSDPVCESVALPIRLVDVGSEERCPFLAETEGMSPGSYLTLSHRWGEGKKFEITVENIDRFKQALPMDELPQTFKDAIVVTRQLGFQYIWIDSLCILQHDEEEWLRESEKMGQIFESSSCTLAAVHALDDDSNDRGLFLPRSDPLAVRICCPVKRTAVPEASAKVRNAAGRNCVWKYEWLKKEGEIDTSDTIRHTIVLRPRIPSLWYKMLQSEWYNRGWVFQERLLSRRIIYYTGAKVYWDCLQEQGDEQGVETGKPSRRAWFSPETIGPSTAKSFAEMLADEYSTSKLSKRKDNLIAILGVCNKFGDHYGQKFHAGILDDGMGQGLLWHAKEDSMPQYRDFHAPSWAWASRSGKPSYYIPEPLGTTPDRIVSRMSFQTRTGCDYNNPHGLCEGTCISGEVSLVAPVGVLLRGQKLYNSKSEGYNGPIESAPNQYLIRILGSGVHSSGISTPRIDTERGTIAHSPRNLFMPRHTEILEDSYGYRIGYLIPDERLESRSDNETISVTCVGVQLWKRQGSLLKEPFGGRVQDYPYDRESCIEVIGLEALAGTPTRYRRIGRGRILCNAWLGQCTEEHITIV